VTEENPPDRATVFSMKGKPFQKVCFHHNHSRNNVFERYFISIQETTAQSGGDFSYVTKVLEITATFFQATFLECRNKIITFKITYEQF
jgi:hypothetical protein